MTEKKYYVKKRINGNKKQDKLKTPQINKSDIQK